MQLELGKIYEGKVTGITKFGAFVEFDAQTTGMVHISEVANTFVNEIRDHITEGQMVKVKVLSIGDDGKISLSIKKAQEMPARTPRYPRKDGETRTFRNNDAPSQHKKPFNNNRNFERRAATVPAGPASFEDMLSKFKQNSEEKMSDLKKNIEGKRRGGTRRGGGKM